ncbi:MAG: hypothetical protein IPM45_13455 [Acidimicrobiales bacterium]|nr:hypothetical protein [Acidimicrobiales bacterium]
MGSLDAAILALASTRWGLVTRRELLAIGVTPRQIDGRTAAGVLVAVLRGVYRAAAWPPSPEQAAAALSLAVGPHGALSHRSAAWLWGLATGPPPRPELTVAGGRRPGRPGVLVHRTRELPPVDVVGRPDGITLTSPGRTLFDLAGVVPFADLVDTWEQAVVQHLVDQRRLRAVLDRLGARGRPGTAAVRRLLAASPLVGGPAPDSRLELRFERLLVDAGLPRPVRQYPLRVGGRTIRLDLAYPQARLDLEVDGRRFHVGEAFQRDRERDRLVAAAAWLPVRFTALDIDEQPARAVATVTALLATRTRSLAG